MKDILTNELRKVVVEILLQDCRTGRQEVKQFCDLSLRVRTHLPESDKIGRGGVVNLSNHGQLEGEDEECLRLLMWDLMREGTIVFGIDVANPKWPFLKVTERGREQLQKESALPAAS